MQRIPLNELKQPDFSRFNIQAYGNNINWPVQTSVSCNNTCKFCSARSVFGDGYESMDPEKAVEEMKALGKGARLYFTDPNVVHLTRKGIKHAKQMFKGMIPQENTWFGSANFGVSKHDSLLAVMKESGCTGLLIGFDSASLTSLEEVSKTKANVPEGKTLMEYYVAGVRKIQEKYGIDVLGTFVIGFDTDDKETIEKTIQLVKESGMKDAQYLPFTPLPGTEMYTEMKEGGRIIDSCFEDYDFTEVVFQPNNFESRDLRSEVVRMYDETFPRMLKLYRRMGLVRDRPNAIRVESMKRRAERMEREARQRRDRHH
ncbi:B12-binding domain-containing radical SAM protein [Thermoproteota archaeon]